MAIFPAPEFAPDQADLPTNSSDAIFNVVPKTQEAYGPMPALSPYATALTARCQGGCSTTDNSDNVRVYMGDASKLYRLVAGSTTPANVSKVGGYSTSSDGIWSNSVYGQRVMFTNGVDAPQSYVEGTSSLFADMILSGFTSLKGKYITTIKDFVAFLNTTDATFGQNTQRVWWSAIDDPTYFPTPGSQEAANFQSDYQDVAGDHGHGMGIVGNLGTADGGVFFERAVQRMIYIGLPDIFAFQPVQGGRGLIAAGALIAYGNIAYGISEEGFFGFDGTNLAPIGKGKIDEFFRNDLQRAYIDRITSGIDPVRGLVVWAYPGVGAVGGICNRLVIYSPRWNKFTATELGAVQVQSLFRSATFGQTLEGLDAFGSIDSLAFGLDSAVWAGGANILAGVDINNQFGYFSGMNLAARIESADNEGLPGRVSKIQRMIPLVDASGSLLSMAARMKLDDAVVYKPNVPVSASGRAPVRSRGRYHRARTTIPANTTWNKFSGWNATDITDVGGR